MAEEDLQREYYKDMVNSLRAPINYKEVCRAERDLVKKCILCKKYLTANVWSIVLEDYIRHFLNIGKTINRVSGDGVIKANDCNFHIEIKVSLGDSTGKFNFVQLRPDHDIHYYIFLAYNVFDGEFGKVYWFLCRPKDLYELLPEFGGYAHGTTIKLGKIQNSNIAGRNCEYALRPNPRANTGTKSRELWNIFLKRFGILAENILDKIGRC
jgi:hypothetical protein